MTFKSGGPSGGLFYGGSAALALVQTNRKKSTPLKMKKVMKLPVEFEFFSSSIVIIDQRVIEFIVVIHS